MRSWTASLAALGCAALALPLQAKTLTVTIENMQFHPRVLIVHRGDRIVWVNRDLFSHSATAKNHAFDSKAIAAQASWAFVVRTHGEFDYSCIFHPTMKGGIRVR